MPPKKKGKSKTPTKTKKKSKTPTKKKGKSKTPKHKRATTPVTPPPPPPIIRPNAFEIIRRRLGREKAARTAAWLLYPDAPSYIRDLKLEEPVDKKKVKKPDITPPTLLPPPVSSALFPPLPTLPPIAIPSSTKSRKGSSSDMSEGAGKVKKAIQLNFNMKDFELKPEEAAWIEGEHLGDSDGGSDHGSTGKYVTSFNELQEYRQRYVPLQKRRGPGKALQTLNQQSSKSTVTSTKGTDRGSRVATRTSKLDSRATLNPASASKLISLASEKADGVA